ncbi:MAG TPA: glycoside hydrolase family 38 C-terminal domain-containing protein [Trebonia sp.]
MTSRLLRSSLGSPDYDEMRAALRRDTSVVVAGQHGITLRAAGLPLLRDGRQAVRVDVIERGDPAWGAGQAGRAELVLSSGGRVLDRSTAEPDRGVLLMAPEVTEPQAVTVELRDGAELLAAGEITIIPQRKWHVFVVHHSHLDIGYTDPQGMVLRNHLEYLDGALALARQTDDWPDDARFRWTVESSLPALRWLEARPPAAVAEFAERARQGRIEVTAFPFQLHTEACSEEELARVLRFTWELRERHGIEVSSAMHTDVPGAVAGVVDALAAAGVRYLSAAHNWAGRSVPYLTGGERLGRPFRWRAPSGSEVLVWFTDTPHGMAYMEGNTVGLADGYELTEDLLPRYLDALAQRPFPYGPEAFGWSGLPAGAPVPDPYPLDAVHLRVQGAHADNAGPNLTPAEIVRRWNETWEYPRLRMATNSEFFRHVEASAPPGTIAVHEGDWTDWWADGLGSGARPLGYVRRAQAALRTAESLDALARPDNAGADSAGFAMAYDKAYDKTALFNEHTWGAANPWLDTEDGGDSGGLQWTLKSAIGYQAHDEAIDLLHASARRFGAGYAPAAALASFLVVNPASATRSDVLEAFLPREIVPLGVPVTLVDSRTGARVPHHESTVHPDDWPTRPIGRKLRAVVRDVPGLGFARLDVITAGRPAAEPEDLGRDGSIENEFYRVRFDAADGVITSVFDKAAGRELVNPDALAGFGQYVHDWYGTAPHVNHLSGHVTATDTTLLSGREIGRRAVIRKAERTPAGERLVAELSGEGLDWLRLTIELHQGVPRVDLTYQLAKRAAAAKESVFVAFPFAATGPPAAWELTGAVGGASRVPGSAEHLAVIRHWVAFEDPELTVAWATLEAPLVQFGTIHLPYAPFPPTLDREPGTVYSWALTNIWDTNFPGQQAGEITFRYAVASAPAVAARQLGVTTSAGLTDPLLAVLATGSGSPAPASAAFCSVSHPDVRVTSIGRSRRGHDLVIRLRSLAPEPVDAEVSVSAAAAAAICTAGERDARPAEVRDGRVRVPLPASGAVELAIDLAAGAYAGGHLFI